MRTIKGDEFLHLINQHKRYLTEPRFRTDEFKLHLENVLVEDAQARQLDLSHAIFKNVTFENVDLSHSTLQHAEFTKCSFIDSKLYATNFTAAAFDRLDFDRCDGTLANFWSARGEGLRVIHESVFDLAGFGKAILIGTHLIESRARGATFIDANLYGLRASRADLAESGLRHAHLRDAVFIESDVSFANLRDADLSAVRLQFTKIEGADFTGTNLRGMKLTCVNVESARTLITHPDYRIRHLLDVKPEADAFARGL
jgi:uncharacterized protein YjbI with pentapeptide repeats